VETCEIKQSEGQYCLSVSLSMKSKTFWTLCDPTTNFGTLRIKVVIGDTTYQFLTEERDTSVAKAGVAFTVWGRSKQALLSKPYSKTINDTDDTSHPWQTGNTTAVAIVAYVIANYCDYSVTVTWNAGNFAVYEDSFSVSNQAPYSVAEGTSVQSYNDLDDIVQLSESIDYPSGYNAVTVYGYGSGGSGSVNATISAERQDTGTIYPGREHTVRVYYYHAQEDTPIYSFPEGNCQLTGSGIESITEDVQLIFGRGNTTKTNTDGETAVTGDTSIPITTVSTTYDVNYRDYAVRGDAEETYNILFYFEDKSAYTIYSFTTATTTSAQSDACSDIVMEKDSPETVVAGSTVLVRVYNPLDYVISGWTTTSGTEVTKKSENNVEQFIEEVTIINGAVTLDYPVGVWHPTGQAQFEISFPDPSVPINTGVSWAQGSKTVTVQAFVDNFDRYYVKAKITYYADYDLYSTVLMGGLDISSENVIANFTECGIKSLSVTIDEAAGVGIRDITINITDYATEVDLEGATVYVDGSSKGTTDSDGNVDVNNVSVGDHTLRITKSGYLNSDLDDLANDTFTVTAE